MRWFKEDREGTSVPASFGKLLVPGKEKQRKPAIPEYNTATFLMRRLIKQKDLKILTDRVKQTPARLPALSSQQEPGARLSETTRNRAKYSLLES